MPGTESLCHCAARTPWAQGCSGQGLLAGSWSFSSAPQLHSMKTQQEEHEKQQTFSFTLGDLLISTSFHEFLVQLTAPKTKAAVVIVFSTSECSVLWDSLCVSHLKIVTLTKNQTLHFLLEQNLRTWQYLEQKFQMLFSGVLLLFFSFSKDNISYISQRKSMKAWRNIFKTGDRKKPHKNSVMSIYAHMRHFLVLIMLSQTLCLMLVILSVVLKSYKEVRLQHVQSF